MKTNTPPTRHQLVGIVGSRSCPIIIGMALSMLFLTTYPLKATEADDGIEAAAKNTYVFRKFLNGESVVTDARDGVVTLSGTVSSEIQRLFAENTVKGLPGVTAVNNQIKIKEGSDKNPSDTMLFVKVKNTLAIRRSVSAMHTKVDVNEGIVTLKGEASSLAQKELTGEYVGDIEGVKGLKNEMTVAATATPPSQSLSDRIDDASITAQVRMGVWSHRSTSGLKVAIVTTEGDVAVAGVASSQAEKDLVTKLVTDIVGVKSVTNTMSTK